MTGCAGAGPEREAEPGFGPAERAATMLEGRYAGRAAGDESAGAALVRLEARVERVTVDGVVVRLSQRTGSERTRAYRLLLAPTRVATRLEGEFSPLDERGAVLGSCPLSVTLRRDGFVATTDAATCRFGNGPDASALIKEIAHDGHRLVIADRVVSPGTGEPVVPDRVLELQRVRQFTGWAGARDADGGSWRVGNEFSLASDGTGFDPVDAAGMPLGFSVDLAPYRVNEGAPPVLRLRVFDRESGELLGQSWADARATRIGVALPMLQVGLRIDGD